MANEETTLLMDILEKKIDILGNMVPGSDEHSRATKDVTDLYRTQLEEIKIGLDESTRQAKSDYDYDRMALEDARRKEEIDYNIRRMELDNKRKIEELDMREREAQVEEKKAKFEFIGRMAGLGTVVIGTLATFWYEDRDNVMPRNKLKLLDKIKIW